MLALANILSKSVVAFVYIGKSHNVSVRRGHRQCANIVPDLGLSLAHNLDDPSISTPQNLLRPDFVEAKRLRMTILSLRSYAQEYSLPASRGLDGENNGGRNQHKMWG